jgi:hypothetical protein
MNRRIYLYAADGTWGRTWAAVEASNETMASQCLRRHVLAADSDARIGLHEIYPLNSMLPLEADRMIAD